MSANNAHRRDYSHLFLLLLLRLGLGRGGSTTATATAAAAAAAATATGGDGSKLGRALLDELGDVLAVNGGEEGLQGGVVNLRGNCGEKQKKKRWKRGKRRSVPSPIFR